MQTVRTVAQARALFRASARPLGFVPTMGALHAGHLELVRQARRQSAAVGASIFVNPLQFGANEDLSTYPRDETGDRAKLEEEGVDVLFLPESAAMYGADFTTVVDAGPLGTTLEGALRPDHFRGVTTVIAKLLNVAQPDVLYLGQKDAQQTAIVRKMVRDLNFAAEVRIVPTVRESDGLAMSSRNGYLDASARANAPSLYRALLATRDALERGSSKHEAIAAGMSELSDAATLDYLDVVNADTFAPLERLQLPAFVVGAARFGGTRLLDNLWLTQ